MALRLAVSHSTPGLTWRQPPGLDRFCSHLATLLRSWEGTPYLPAQQMQGVGVDCVRFVCAIYDALLQRKRTAMPILPQDTALHDRKKAIRAMRQIRRLYPEMAPVRNPRFVEPGDLLVVGETTGGPGHAILVGPERNTLWQTGTLGVYKGGFGLIDTSQQLFRVYRLRDRESI